MSGPGGWESWIHEGNDDTDYYDDDDSYDDNVFEDINDNDDHAVYKYNEDHAYYKKNPAYWRYWIPRPMLIVAPIPKRTELEKGQFFFGRGVQ